MYLSVFFLSEDVFLEDVFGNRWCPSLPLWSSFQEYGSLGSVQTESEYERQMMSVFSRVLEEVEGLTKKHPPVSFLVSLIWNTL